MLRFGLGLGFLDGWGGGIFPAFLFVDASVLVARVTILVDGEGIIVGIDDFLIVVDVRLVLGIAFAYQFEGGRVGTLYKPFQEPHMALVLVVAAA